MLGSSRQRSKTILLVVAVFIAAMFAFMLLNIPVGFAQDTGLADVGDASGLETTSLYTVIGRIIGVFLGLLGIIFLILMLYAGFLWMTAAGNEETVAKAKRILTQAVIGLIITLSAFAITNFVVNALTGSGLLGGDGGAGTGTGVGPGFSTVPRSGSLGQGGIVDHYPARNATDISRNTKIFVTFKDAMNVDDFVETFDDGGTPDDATDDTATLNANAIHIYPTNAGRADQLSAADVAVSFTEDRKTVVFDPPLLGSASDDVQYTVLLDDSLKSADGRDVINNGGYEWIFTVGTLIDVDPPSVRSVTPAPGGNYDRNISIQLTFSEAIDPVAGTGSFSLADPAQSFTHIQGTDAAGNVIEGTYRISNEYKTITFQTSQACGVNSCNATIYCLPASQIISVLVAAATPGTDPPQVDIFPYDGIVDTSGNALDGNGDGAAGDDYAFDFETTNNINLEGPTIESIVPVVLGSNVAIDQRVLVTFDDVLLTNSVIPGKATDATPGNLSLEPNPFHELSFRPLFHFLNGSNENVSGFSDVAEKTELEIDHGVFLVSSDVQTYNYGISIGSNVLNQYQNCFNPAAGPDKTGAGVCEGAPYCCNGKPSAAACTLF